MASFCQVLIPKVIFRIDDLRWKNCFGGGVVRTADGPAFSLTSPHENTHYIGDTPVINDDVTQPEDSSNPSREFVCILDFETVLCPCCSL